VLTGLRAVAAWLVFFHHYPFANTPLGRTQHLIADLLPEGLPILLLLSGFLIALRYDEPTSTSLSPKGGWKRYLQNRIARIYPLYAILTLLTFTLLYHWHSPKATPGILLLNLTFLRGFFDDYKFTGVLQGWSLTLLECFYLSAPLLLGLRRRGLLPLWLQPLLLLLLGLGLVKLVAPLPWHGFFGSNFFMLSYTFLGHSLEFYVGVWIAGRYLNHQLPTRQTWLGLTGAALLLLFAHNAALVYAQTSMVAPIEHPLTLVVRLLIAPFFYGLLLMGLLGQNSWLRHVLSSPIFQQLGYSSYALYLLHAGPLSFWIYERLPDFWPLRLLAVQAVSYGMYRLLEEPLGRWLRPAR
jgi:peptidoglycan/LPS O-acetylase OafA/YrhL